jgi:hypothetical protein
MALMPNPLLRRLPSPHDPIPGQPGEGSPLSLLAAALGHHHPFGATIGAGAPTGPGAPAGPGGAGGPDMGPPPDLPDSHPFTGSSVFRLEALANALKGHGHGSLGAPPHFGAPTPPPGVAAAPEGSYNPAEFYRHEGQDRYAAQLWESHHPYAMAHGHEPAWVQKEMTHGVQGMVGSRGTKYTEPIRHRRPGLAQALQTVHGSGGAVHPVQVG